MIRIHKGLFLLFSLCMPAGCSGVLLSGDGGEDGAADTRDGAESADPLSEETETPDLVSDDADVLACVQTYSGCSCEPGCVDGFSEYVWYSSNDGGPFPSDTSPPPELLAIGIARYQCSVCGCTESWSVGDGGTWRGSDVLEMCQRIVAENRSCGGCLVTWSGGCC